MICSCLGRVARIVVPLLLIVLFILLLVTYRQNQASSSVLETLFAPTDSTSPVLQYSEQYLIANSPPVVTGLIASTFSFLSQTYAAIIIVAIAFFVSLFACMC